MAKIRHIAIKAEDQEKTASFYQQTFGMNEVRQGVAWTPQAIGGEPLPVPPALQQIDSHTSGIPETSKCLGIGSFLRFENSQKARLLRQQWVTP